MSKIIWILLLVLLTSLAWSQRLAYITPQGGLATIAADGSELRILDEQRSYQFPAWSPDNRYIASLGSDAQGGGVFVFEDRDDTEALKLYQNRSEGAFYAYWSPDARYVSFLANNPEAGIALHLANIANQSSDIIALGQPFYWDWASDSQIIVKHTGLQGPGVSLELFQTQTQEVLVELAETPGFFQAPGFSASEQYIAYAKRDLVGEGKLVIATNPLSDGAEAVEREVPHRGVVAFNWSPQTDRLAFISPPVESMSYYGNLRLLDAETGDLEVLTDDIVVAFFWSPDGQKIAYLTPFRDNGGQALLDDWQVSSALRAQMESVFLNLYVIDVDTGDSSLLSTFIPSRLFIGQFIPFFDQYALSHRIWSADSRYLALAPLGDDFLPRITVFDVQTGEGRQLTTGESPFWTY